MGKGSKEAIMEPTYVQTEYDRITNPIVRRYERDSAKDGVRYIPIDTAGRDQQGNKPGDIAATQEPEQSNDIDAGTAERDESGNVGRGWFG